MFCLKEKNLCMVAAHSFRICQVYLCYGDCRGFANNDDELAGTSSPEYGDVGKAAHGRAEGYRQLEYTWRFEWHDGHEGHWEASGVQGRRAAVRRVEGKLFAFQAMEWISWAGSKASTIDEDLIEE